LIMVPCIAPAFIIYEQIPKIVALSSQNDPPIYRIGPSHAEGYEPVLLTTSDISLASLVEIHPSAGKVLAITMDPFSLSSGLILFICPCASLFLKM